MILSSSLQVTRFESSLNNCLKQTGCRLGAGWGLNTVQSTQFKWTHKVLRSQLWIKAYIFQLEIQTHLLRRRRSWSGFDDSVIWLSQFTVQVIQCGLLAKSFWLYGQMLVERKANKWNEAVPVDPDAFRIDSLNWPTVLRRFAMFTSLRCFRFRSGRSLLDFDSHFASGEEQSEPHSNRDRFWSLSFKRHSRIFRAFKML